MMEGNKSYLNALMLALDPIAVIAVLLVPTSLLAAMVVHII